MDLFQPRTSSLTFLQNYPDNHREFEIEYDGKTCKAIGSERKYRFMCFLATTPYVGDYKLVTDPIETIFAKEMHTDDLYAFLTRHEYQICMMFLILFDVHFLHSALQANGWINNIKIIFHSLPAGTSASTETTGNFTLIKINLLAFIHWIETMSAHKATSISDTKCSSVIQCMAQTVAHELCHAILQQSTPCILYKKQILVRSKDPFEHYRLSKLYTDNSAFEEGIYFAFGQKQKGPGTIKAGEPFGHHSTFISMLRLRFGQQRAAHTYFDLNYKLKF